MSEYFMMRRLASPRRDFQVVALALAFVALIVVGWMLGLAATSRLGPTDKALLAVFTSERLPQFTPLVRVLTYLGSGWVLVPAAAVICFLLYRAGRGNDAVFVVIVLLGALVLPEIVKLLVARARPSVALVNVSTFDFPSGHAAQSAAFYGAIALVVTCGRGRLLTVGVWSAAIILTAFVGWTRLYLGVHYPSDVIGGYLLGAAWLAAVAISRRYL